MKKEAKAAKPARVSESALINARAKRKPRPDQFKMPQPAPGVLPANHKGMAQDSALGSLYAYGAGYSSNGAQMGFSLNYGFIGYPYLAQLAQRAEFRKISETIAREMTRKWIRIIATNDDDDKTDEIGAIEAEFKRLEVQHHFRRAAELDGYFGISHIYMDMGDTGDDAELKTELFASPEKVSEKKPIKRLKTVEPIWTYPNDYNSTDALSEAYFKPQTWFVQGRAIHASRLLTFVSREVPDMLKPAYAFGGLSMTQMALDYVENWLRTRQSVSDLIHSFSTVGVKTDISSAMNSGAGIELDRRAELFNLTRDNSGVMLLDFKEEFFNVATPLGTLDHLQAQAQEQMASVASIPLVKLLGITPSGLNASSDGEIRSFYDWIESSQEQLFTSMLKRLLDIVQLSLFGKIDPDISFRYEPLWQLDEAGQAAVRKTDADTDAVLIDAGVLAPIESRKRVANGDDSPYQGLDVEDVPEPPEMPGEADTSDTSQQIDKAGAEGAETEANSGV